MNTTTITAPITVTEVTGKVADLRPGDIIHTDRRNPGTFCTITGYARLTREYGQKVDVFPVVWEDGTTGERVLNGDRRFRLTFYRPVAR